jgi:hypothetical protein
LSQWRAYCPKGNGFSIGFTASQLKYLRQHTHFRLIQCAYTAEEKGELVRRTARFIDRIHGKGRKFNEPSKKFLLSADSYSRSWIYLTAIKHEGV